MKTKLRLCLRQIHNPVIFGILAMALLLGLTPVLHGQTGRTYDKYGRPLTEKRNIDGAGLLEFSFAYNGNGQLQKTVYPGALEVNYEYDAYGNRVKALAGTQPVWELTGAGGTTTTSLLGGTMTATTTHNSQGLLTGLKTVKGTATIRNMDFAFNGATGNLTSRTGMLPQKETFYYDNLDRLTGVKQGSPESLAMSIGYAANGNITSKTGLGIYSYNASKVHALSGVDNTGGLIPDRDQAVTYNAFNKVAQISETAGDEVRQLDIAYGPDGQRWKTELRRNGSVAKTVIFAGDYERVIKNDTVTHLYYMEGGGIYVKQTKGSTILRDGMYYAHPDHLSSLTLITDATGGTVQKCSFDAWGKRTFITKTPSLVFDRGFTGHEHLDEFGLINMNGRMYDPVVGRFLSPDPYVADGTYSQDYNRYSYARNNPLIYTDPDGEFVHLIVGAVIGGFMNLMMNAHNVDNFWQGLGYFGIGAAAGALGAGVGAGVSSMLPVSGAVSGGFSAGFWGTSAATTATSSFISGAAIGGAAGFSSGFVGGLGNGLIGGQNFGNALWSGTKTGFIGGLSGAAIGGITSGINAVRDDRRFWDGAKVNDYRLRDHNIPYVPQNADYNCGPASAEAVTNHQLDQNDVRTALRGDPNKEGLVDVRVMQHIQRNSGRGVYPTAQYGGVDAIYDAMTNQGNVVLSLGGTGGNPGHMVVANSVWERTVTKISGRVIQRLFLEVMDPARGQYVWKSIGNNQRFFTIFF